MTDDRDPRSVEDRALVAAVTWLEAVAGRLRDVVPAADRLLPDVQRDWPDEQGRAWVERASQVRRSLVRELEAAEDLARVIARLVLDPPGLQPLPFDPAAPGASPGRSAPRRGGPQLGGTEGEQAGDGRGVSIPELSDAGGAPG